MITYGNVDERLKLYRSEPGGGPSRVKLLGIVNIFTGEEYKPFLNSLSKEEKAEIEECRKQALQEYQRLHAVDPTALASLILKLAENAQRITCTPAEQSRLLLACQKLRTSFKNSQSAEGGEEDDGDE